MRTPPARYHGRSGRPSALRRFALTGRLLSASCILGLHTYVVRIIFLSLQSRLKGTESRSSFSSVAKNTLVKLSVVEIYLFYGSGSWAQSSDRVPLFIAIMACLWLSTRCLDMWEWRNQSEWSASDSTPITRLHFQRNRQNYVTSMGLILKPLR